MSDLDRPSGELLRRCNMRFDAGGNVIINGTRQTLIDIAYVADPDPGARTVRDIYEAQELYLSQTRQPDAPEPDFGRVPLACFCSDERCRTALRPKITPRAYREAPVEGQSYKQRPHFGWNPKSAHLAECPWVVVELAKRMETSAAISTKAQHAKRSKRGEGPPRSEMFGIFVLPTEGRNVAVPAESYLPAFSPDASFGDRLGQAHQALRNLETRPRRTPYLRDIVRTYVALYESDRTGELDLQIEGRTQNYRFWFRSPSRYAELPAHDKKRIWLANARVVRGNADYRLEFIEQIALEEGGTKRDLVLTMSDAALAASSRGPYLRETLEVIRHRRIGPRYVRAFWYGEIADSPTGASAAFGSLERLHLALPRGG